MKKIFLLAGARPNFMKIAPLSAALAALGVECPIIHTGQHYDELMSDVFFRELNIPKPRWHFNIGPGDRREQTKKILDALIPLLRSEQPEALLTVGDVTSTAAGAMAGIAAGTPVIHVEAGLRSFNWRMPEELNRMIADHHSALLFATEQSGVDNLCRESIPADRIFLTGNVMIDSLRRAEKMADGSTILQRLELMPKTYGVLTAHRPENVDQPENFRALWKIAELAATFAPVVFPVHPRTKAAMERFGLQSNPRIRLIDPLGYVDMVALLKQSKFVLTDSGGLQEETTALDVPCLTLRQETERPVTVSQGTSELVGLDEAKVDACLRRVQAGEWKRGKLPDLWDGQAAQRIARILADTNL